MGNVLPTQKQIFHLHLHNFLGTNKTFYLNFFHESCNSMSIFSVEIEIT